MANETAQAGQAQSQQGDAGRQTQQRQGGQRPAQEGNQGAAQTQSRPAATAQAERPAATQQGRQVAVRRDGGLDSNPPPGMVFDPHGAIRVGMLRLARNWANEGHVYSAINTYREVLVRYPGTGVAAAAVEDMLDLALFLESRGMYFTALNLFHVMEELV